MISMGPVMAKASSAVSSVMMDLSCSVAAQQSGGDSSNRDKQHPPSPKMWEG